MRPCAVISRVGATAGRQINTFTNRLLLGGCLAEKHEFNADDVNTLIEDLREEGSEHTAQESTARRDDADDDSFNEDQDRQVPGKKTKAPLSPGIDERLVRVEEAINRLTASFNEFLKQARSRKVDV